MARRDPARPADGRLTRRSGHPTTHRSPGDADTPGAPGSPDPSTNDGGQGIGDRVKATVGRVDDVNRRHPVIAVPFAVVKKFGDDRGGQWAALVAYYGFFSLFPLLLVLTTILAFVLEGDTDLQERIVNSAVSQFPVIGNEIARNIRRIEGSWVALVIGVVGAVWSGMGVILTLQTAMDEIWDVPRRSRPNFLKSRLRALIALVGFGVAMLLSAALATFGATQGSFGWVVRILAFVGTFALNAAVFGAVFRYLTVADVRWRQVLPGAALAAVLWMALLALGTWLVDRQLRGASDVYGTFALVLGLLSWIYLGAQVLLLSAEVNVVLARKLWPRSIAPPPLTEPDKQVLAAQAKEQAARPTQDVEVDFDPPDEPGTGDPPGGRA